MPNCQEYGGSDTLLNKMVWFISLFNVKKVFCIIHRVRPIEQVIWELYLEACNYKEEVVSK